MTGTVRFIIPDPAFTVPCQTSNNNIDSLPTRLANLDLADQGLKPLSPKTAQQVRKHIYQACQFGWGRLCDATPILNYSPPTSGRAGNQRATSCITIQDARIPQHSIRMQLDQPIRHERGRSYNVIETPPSLTEMEELIQVFSQRAFTHIVQLCSEQQFADKPNTLADWFNQWSEAGGTRLQGAALKSIEQIDTMHSNDVNTLKAIVVRHSRISNKSYKFSILSTNLKITDNADQYITADELCKMYMVLIQSCGLDHLLRNDTGPVFITKNSSNSGAALMTLMEVIEQHKACSYVDINDLIDGINQIIKVGKEKKGDGFMADRKQYDELVTAAVQLAFRVE